jgi:hypothetical protein
LHSEPICDPVHVCVVGGHLADIEDVPVREPNASQRVEILRNDPLWTDRQLFGIAEHCSASIIDRCRLPVRFDGGEQVVIVEEPSQTATVMGHSVVALVEGAHNKGDHLSVDPSKILRPCHC